MIDLLLLTQGLVVRKATLWAALEWPRAIDAFVYQRFGSIAFILLSWSHPLIDVAHRIKLGSGSHITDLLEGSDWLSSTHLLAPQKTGRRAFLERLGTKRPRNSTKLVSSSTLYNLLRIWLSPYSICLPSIFNH